MTERRKNKIQAFKEKVFMSKDFKKSLVQKNLIRVIIITPLLILFSGILLWRTLFIPGEINRVGDLGVAYYSIIFIMSSVSLITSLVFLKFKNMNPMIRNIPLFLLFFGFMLLVYVIFTRGPNPFNAFVVFVCVGTIVPLVFTIEPLVYNTLVLAVYIAMSSRLYNLYSFGAVFNVAIYVVVLNILGMTRWFSLMAKHRHEQLRVEHEKMIEKELEMAYVVQKSFFNHDLSETKCWDVAYYNNPMMSLSGDLFDFYLIKDHLEGVCIFDVSGHGLSAGLVTMLVKNIMEEEFFDNLDYELDFTMQRINKRVKEAKGSIENYLTGLILRFGDDKIEMVNAGHPLPVIYDSKSGSCKYFECEPTDCQGAIGLGDLNFDFKTLEFNLAANDRIILYTDGIPEAKNSRRELFGHERFLKVVSETCHLPVQQQIEEIVGTVKDFIGNSKRTDDISILIFQKKDL